MILKTNTPKMEVGIEIWRNIHVCSVVWLSDVFLWLIMIITDKLPIEVFVRTMASAFQNRKVPHFIHSLVVSSCKQSSFPRDWNTLQLLKLWHQKKWYVGSEIRISGNKHQLCPPGATFWRTDESIRSRKAGFGVFCLTSDCLTFPSEPGVVEVLVGGHICAVRRKSQKCWLWWPSFYCALRQENSNLDGPKWL